MSALRTRLTRGDAAATASTARLTTAITSSHSPSMLVNIALVSLGRPDSRTTRTAAARSEEHTSELQSRRDLVCRLLLEKKKKKKKETLMNSEKYQTCIETNQQSRRIENI